MDQLEEPDGAYAQTVASIEEVHADGLAMGEGEPVIEGVPDVALDTASGPSEAKDG